MRARTLMGGETAGRILQAAADLFAERGYAATSVQALADRLGITKAALYHHFDGKDAILDAILDPVVSAVSVLLETRTSPAETPAERWALLEQLRATYRQHPMACRVLSGDRSVWRDPTLGQRVHRNQLQLIDRMAGPDPTPAARERANLLLQLAFFCDTRDERLLPRTDATQDIVEQVLRMVAGEPLDTSVLAASSLDGPDPEPRGTPSA